MRGTSLLCMFCFVLASVGMGEPMEGNGGPKNLSDEEHYKEGEHNVKYDHEAFLGKERAKEFDELTPEEAKRRLGILVDKIDADNDGFVSQEELANWVSHVNNRRVYEYVSNRLAIYDANNDGKVTLEEYQIKHYGTVEDDDEIYDRYRQLTFRQSKSKDLRRFNVADQNGDGELDEEEFSAYVHPEGVPHMRETVISESMEDKDSDQDGLITLEEYIDNIWPKRQRREGEEEPEWVQNEREHFTKHRDKDGDMKVNREELTDWMFPSNYDPTQAEAAHLIYHSDTDKDEKLTKEEILEHMDHFVGSRATEFGKYLNRHDEF